MAELNPGQFETLAKVLRSHGPSKEAVRLVLVEGQSIKEAVGATGTLQPVVSRSVARYRAMHMLISDGYSLTAIRPMQVTS
jgi:hypothetical protein